MRFRVGIIRRRVFTSSASLRNESSKKNFCCHTKYFRVTANLNLVWLGDKSPNF